MQTQTIGIFDFDKKRLHKSIWVLCELRWFNHVFDTGTSVRRFVYVYFESWQPYIVVEFPPFLPKTWGAYVVLQKKRNIEYLEEISGLKRGFDIAQVLIIYTSRLTKKLKPGQLYGRSGPVAKF